jgi:very-short-patch-repair endonuclease
MTATRVGVTGGGGATTAGGGGGGGGATAAAGGGEGGGEGGGGATAAAGGGEGGGRGVNSTIHPSSGSRCRVCDGWRRKSYCHAGDPAPTVDSATPRPSRRSGRAGRHHSKAEELFLTHWRDTELIQPRVNTSVGPYRLDFYWPGHGIAIEVDGYRHHGTRPRFEGDRARTTYLAGRGIQVIPVTWRHLTRHPTRTIAQIARALALAESR